MSLISKVKTLTWYLARPKYYSQMPSLFKQALFGSNDEASMKKNLEWCNKYSVPTEKALNMLTGQSEFSTIESRYPAEYKEAQKRQDECPLPMGGAGNIDLIYNLCEFLKANTVIETGVSFGWSSLAILLSIDKRQGRLFSIDMPYAKMNNEDYVGVVVPQQLRSNWELIRLPDRKGIKIALDKTKSIDLCHYDSDKSYEGRMFAYPLLWNALRPGGFFISDDIQDNLGFHDFCIKNQFSPVIVESNGKYIGVIKKPV